MIYHVKVLVEYEFDIEASSIRDAIDSAISKAWYDDGYDGSIVTIEAATNVEE